MKHGSCLRIGRHAWPEFTLDTGQSTVELLGSRRTPFDLFEGFVENLVDIEQTNNVALFIADWLRISLVLRARTK